MKEKLSNIEIKPGKKPEQEVMLEEITELEEPVKNIVEKIKERIEKGEYGLIIGDDASGRIPAIILGNFIKAVAKSKNLDIPSSIFIPGKVSHLSPDELSRRGAKKKKRILVVTDVIQSGRSLRGLAKAIKQAGYECDIAAIGIEYPYDRELVEERKRNLEGFEVVSGGYYNPEKLVLRHTPRIYGEKHLSGVYKQPGDQVSKTFKSSALSEDINPEDVNPETIETHLSRQEIQESINRARADVNIMVNRLFDWYEQNE